MEQTISERQKTILELLESGPASPHYIAGVLSCPQASVRRDIQTLRREGYRISFADYSGQYRLDR